jgi:hypothetical protein
MKRYNEIVYTVAAVGLLLVALNGCNFKQNSRELEAQAQEQASMQATRSVGMPGITNYQEKRTLKMILELRDTALSTTTYIVDLNGNLHKICDSVGYGIPYATQYTNPSMIDYSSAGRVVLPQADPNGLFSPPAAEGTWVSCLDPVTKKVAVLYIEPRVIVSPFALDHK